MAAKTDSAVEGSNHLGWACCLCRLYTYLAGCSSLARGGWWMEDGMADGVAAKDRF